jgi:alpha-beta hydrolase superfamily lysophospholipase
LIQDHSFQFQGHNGRGMLLIHGLTGTPLEMRLLGKGLNNAGFTVHGVQLAGRTGTAASSAPPRNSPGKSTICSSAACRWARCWR